MMKKILRIIIKWLLRIILGLASLVIIIVLLFFLFRGKIVDKALDYVNKAQPGVVSLDKLMLRPFLDFPDVSLELKDFQYSTGAIDSIGANLVPLIQLEKIYVSLDILKLLKGKYYISKIRLGDGEVNYLIGADSISNIEKALGIRFGQSSDKEENIQDSSILILDLKSVQIRNLRLNYSDLPGDTKISLKINGLESGLSYYPDTITANIMMHMDLISASVKEILLDKSRSVSLNASLIYDQPGESLILGKSVLALNDAVFVLEGNVLLSQHLLDLRFSAQNRGIDLLNFLLNGVLDIQAIEQIGEGAIRFDGEVSGSYDKNIPEVKVKFSASDMGFRVHTIDQSITNIGFEGYATNGKAKDMSEAEFSISKLHLDFPEGALEANIKVSDLLIPKVYVDINGNADLSILNEILQTEVIQNMKGSVSFEGKVDGILDKSSGKFLEDAGALAIQMHDVSLSLPDNQLESLNGKIIIEENTIGLENLQIRIDSSDIHLKGTIDYLLPYFLGYPGDPALKLSLSSEALYYYKFLGDSIYSEPIRDLQFNLSLNTTSSELKKAIEKGLIPNFDLALDHLEFKYPGYTSISDGNLAVSLDESRLILSEMSARVGASKLDLRAEIMNYGAFLEKDSTEEISLRFEMASKALRARDLLTFNDEFLILPAEFIDEQLINFFFKGNIQTTVGELLINSALPDFSFQSDRLEMDFKYYPLSFRNFVMDVEHTDSLLKVNSFKGSVGNNNLSLSASIANLFDSTKVMAGDVNIHSDLLDVNELMDYELLAKSEVADSTASDTSPGSSAELDLIDFPDLNLNIDVAEFKFDMIELFGLNGKIRLKPYKIIYLDRFAVRTETGGSVVLDGQFNVSDSDLYILSASLEIDTLNMSDFDIQVAMQDKVYSLHENFNGTLSGKGMAEFFINPDLSINLDTSTAMFNIYLQNGRVKNFAPLHAVAKYTGNKDLDDVQFGELRNSFTLVNGAIQIPLMSISSSLGLFLIEGEQGLRGEMLYLVRVPLKLIRETAWNVLSNQQRKETEEEGEVQTLVLQKFAILTVHGEGEEIEVKKGDKREDYK